MPGLWFARPTENAVPAGPDLSPMIRWTDAISLPCPTLAWPTRNAIGGLVAALAIGRLPQPAEERPSRLAPRKAVRRKGPRNRVSAARITS
jgi:hypothetical protein